MFLKATFFSLFFSPSFLSFSSYSRGWSLQYIDQLKNVDQYIHIYDTIQLKALEFRNMYLYQCHCVFSNRTIFRCAYCNSVALNLHSSSLLLINCMAHLQVNVDMT